MQQGLSAERRGIRGSAGVYCGRARAKMEILVKTMVKTTVLTLIAVLCFGMSVSFAQVETARITGTVTDATGAVIPAVEVVVTHVQTNRRFVTQTDAEGRYEAPNLPLGDYEVVLETDGFKRTVRTGINLEVREAAVVDIALEVGQLTESVSVVADAPLLTTVEAAQGEVISNKQIVDLPLNGRSYLKLALLSTGAMITDTGRRASFSSSGMRPSQNNVMLDGIDNNNLQSATHARRSDAASISIDAVQEFKVETNSFTAEYGKSAGGVVNVVMKSGTNQVHGTVFGFLRNEVFDAKNFFDDPDKPRAPFKRSQFGFAAGGPIIKNRTFIFGDYEGTRVRESRTANNTIPTVKMRQGDFTEISDTIFDPATLHQVKDAKGESKFVRDPFPGNIIPSSRIDRISAQAKDWYPDPTNNKLTRNFLQNPPRSEDRNRGDVKVDHIFSESDNIFFRYSHDVRNLPASPSLPIPAIGGAGNTGGTFNHKGQNMGLAWNHIFTPTILTSTRIGWNNTDTKLSPIIDYNANAQLGLTGVDQEQPGSVRFNISGVTNLGIGPNVPNDSIAQTRQLKNDTTVIRGRHTFKFGADLMWLQNYLKNPKRRLGDFQFNGNFTRNPFSPSSGKKNVGGDPFADFLLGIPRRSQVARGVFMALRGQFHQFYFQDEWKATQKLTVNIGVRYQVFLPWVEDSRDGWVNFDIEANPANPPLVVAVPGGSRLERSHVQTDASNFGPRIGIAYQVRPDTVIRAGYGIFHGTWDPPGGGKLMQSNPPFEARNWISTDNIHPEILLENGFPNSPVNDDFDPRAATNMSVTNYQRDRSWPYSQHWNLNIQQGFGSDWMLEVGYFAAKTTHAIRKYDMNFSPPGPGNINKKRRWKSIVFPGTDIVISPLGEVFRHQFDGDANFHSAQLKIKKRLSGGLNVLGSYAFSKNIDDFCAEGGGGTTSGCGEPQDTNNFRLNKALSTLHVKHQLVGSVIYDLPFGRGRRWGSGWNGVQNRILGGWTLASIITLRSGLPFSGTVRGNPANTNTTNRPNVLGDPLLSSDERTLDRWFNTDMLEKNKQFQFGNAARNILFSPDRRNWDFAVYRQFQLTESKHLQFRFEAFNSTNTPPFNTPEAEVGNRDFGRITSAGGSRNIQFGLKFIF